MADLIVPHHSVRNRRRIRPCGMDTLPMSTPDYDAVAKIATEIFADMLNAGSRFEEALVAIYLSGLNAGVWVSKERAEPSATVPPLRSKYLIKKVEA